MAATFVTAAGISLAVCGLAIVMGTRLGIVDHPDGALKPHDRPIPPLGGAGVFAGLHVGLWVAGLFDIALFTATGVVWILGMVDDRFGLSPRPRLVGVGLAGVALVAVAEVSLFSLMGLFWVIAVLVVVNAMNLFDGLDGLAGSISIVAITGIWVLGLLLHSGAETSLFVVALGAILGFVGWNWPPARIFLGDNGAYVVGVTLIWLAIGSAPRGGGALVGVALIGAPLLDLAATVVRRVRSGADMTSGGRDHFYDRLHGTGLKTAAVTAAMVAGQVVWMAVLLLVMQMGSQPAAVTTAIVLGTVSVALLSRYPEPSSA